MFNDDRDPLRKDKNRDYRDMRDYMIDQLERVRRRVVSELRSDQRFQKDIDIAFWNEIREWFETDLQLMFIGMANTAAEAVLGTEGMPALDIAELNAPITEWALDHAGELIGDAISTTREGIGRAVANYFSTPGTTIGDLIEQINDGPLFSGSRAEMIAVTEVTRAYSEGQIAAWTKAEQDYAVQVEKIWNTNNDDRVCVICEPLNNKPETPEGGFDPSGVGPGIPFPPAHPRCRCWLTQRIKRV
jgi:SPP1 gp7 family putative phage head morphogenesis protein